MSGTWYNLENRPTETINEDSHKAGSGLNDEAFRITEKDGLVVPYVPPVHFHLHSSTEILCKWNTVEVLANTALMDWCNVEQNDKNNEQTERKNQADNDPYQLVSTVFEVEGYMWHECKGKEKAIQESKHMSIVVDHWKEADNEQHE